MALPTRMPREARALHRLLLATVSPLAVAVLSVPAFAQTSTSQNDPGPVASSPAPSPEAVPQGGLKDVIVQGKGPIQAARKRLDKIAGAVHVVDVAKVEEGGVVNNADLLAYQPGVYAVNDSGSDAAKVSIRGSGINGDSGGYRQGVFFFFDGLPLTGAGETPVDLIEPLGLESTEIQIGANAFDLGVSELGGSINYVTKNGYDSSPLQLRVEAGSYGYVKGQISTGGVRGPFDYYISITGSRIDGYQPNSQQQSTGVVANLGYQINSNVETRLFIRYRDRDSYTPGQITLQQLKINPKAGIFAYQQYQSHSPAHPVFIGSLTTAHFDDGSTLQVGLEYHYHPWEGYYGTAYLNQPTYADIDGLIRYQRDDSIFGHDSVTTIGTLLLNSQNVVKTNTRAIGNDTILYQNAFDGTNSNFYLTNDTQVAGGLHLLTGGAIDRIWRQGQIIYPTVSHDWNDVSVTFLPRVGLLYNLNPDIQFYGNLSRSLQPPPDFDIPSTGAVTYPSGPAEGQFSEVGGVKNQSAYTIEIGTRGTVPVIGTWSLSLYRAWLRDELLDAQITESVGGVDYTEVNETNATPTIHQGIEAGLTTPLWDDRQGNNLILNQAYTYSDFHYQDDPVFGHNELPGIPAHYYQAELSYHASNGFYAGLNTQIASKNYLDYANSEAAPAYALMGATIGWKIPRTKWGVFGDFRNLFNVKYAEAVTPVYDLRTSDTGTISPGDGFNFIAGATFDY